MIPIKNCEQVRSTKIPPREYVDDALILNKGRDETHENGQLFCRAVKFVALECNANKSAVIIMGRDNIKTRLACVNLTNDPMLLHSQPVPVKIKEPYLGLILHQNRVRTSINETAKSRSDKAWGKASMIKSIINHPAMTQYGWLLSSVTLIKAIIPAVLSYSSKVWSGSPKYIIENIESNHKKIIYSVLNIPEKTKFSAILLELGMTRMRQVIAKRQILYMNHVLWEMKRTITWASVLEEWETNSNTSMLHYVDCKAFKYGLPCVRTTTGQETHQGHDKALQ